MCKNFGRVPHGMLSTTHGVDLYGESMVDVGACSVSMYQALSSLLKGTGYEAGDHTDLIYLFIIYRICIIVILYTVYITM